MKTLITLFLTLFLGVAHLASAQKTIDGFMGIPFGSTKSKAIEVAKSRGGVFVPGSSDNDVSLYKNVKLGSRTTLFSAYYTFDNKFYQGVAVFMPSTEGKTLDLFDTIKEEIDGVYGEGEMYRHFKSPYEEGDGYELTAIQTGSATISCFWSTPNKDGNENYISLEITENLNIKLTYQDGSIIKQVVAAAKAKQAAEY